MQCFISGQGKPFYAQTCRCAVPGNNDKIIIITAVSVQAVLCCHPAQDLLVCCSGPWLDLLLEAPKHLNSLMVACKDGSPWQHQEQQQQSRQRN